MDEQGSFAGAKNDEKQEQSRSPEASHHHYFGVNLNRLHSIYAGEGGGRDERMQRKIYSYITLGKLFNFFDLSSSSTVNRDPLVLICGDTVSSEWGNSAVSGK